MIVIDEVIHVRDHVVVIAVVPVTGVVDHVHDIVTIRNVHVLVHTVDHVPIHVRAPELDRDHVLKAEMINAVRHPFRQFSRSLWKKSIRN